MKIATFTTLLHTVHAQTKELESMAREALAEMNTAEKRLASLTVDIRNAESNLSALEDRRVKLEAELSAKVAELKKK